MPAFDEAGIKVYAVSYDDQAALREFAEKQEIPFPLLSDLGSRVIRDYGILNDGIDENDAFLFGIPYPGVYLCDEAGIVSAKFFHDTYKKRDSPETLIAAALGRIDLADDAPSDVCEDAEVRVTAAVHGGRGTLRQGIVRNLVVRFEPAAGLHLYGEPVPQGMIATTVEASGPEGIVFGEPRFPDTRPLRLPGIDAELAVFDGVVDVVVPFYPDGRIASETRPLDQDAVELVIAVRFQACDDDTCLLPKSETLRLQVPLDVIDVPNLSLHTGHGQREGGYDAMPHMRRMVLRSLRRSPLGFARFLLKTVRLERAAKRRRHSGQH